MYSLAKAMISAFCSSVSGARPPLGRRRGRAGLLAAGAVARGFFAAASPPLAGARPEAFSWPKLDSINAIARAADNARMSSRPLDMT